MGKSKSRRTPSPASSSSSEPREVLSGFGGSAGDLERYRERWRTALRLVLAEARAGGEPVSVEIARSRASREFGRLAYGLDFDQAEKVRCEVTREELLSLGIEPLNVPPFEGPGTSLVLVDDGDPEPPLPRVPRGEPVPGHQRVRLSGAR